MLGMHHALRAVEGIACDPSSRSRRRKRPGSNGPRRSGWMPSKKPTSFGAKAVEWAASRLIIGTVVSVKPKASGMGADGVAQLEHIDELDIRMARGEIRSAALFSKSNSWAVKPAKPATCRERLEFPA